MSYRHTLPSLTLAGLLAACVEPPDPIQAQPRDDEASDREVVAAAPPATSPDKATASAPDGSARSEDLDAMVDDGVDLGLILDEIMRFGPIAGYCIIPQWCDIDVPGHDTPPDDETSTQ